MQLAFQDGKVGVSLSAQGRSSQRPAPGVNRASRYGLSDSVGSAAAVGGAVGSGVRRRVGVASFAAFVAVGLDVRVGSGVAVALRPLFGSLVSSSVGTAVAGSLDTVLCAVGCCS